MSKLTRRDLLSSGLAFSASSVLARSAWARAATFFDESSALASSASGSCAPRTAAFRLRLEVHVRPWLRSRQDLGFGYGQGDFAKTGEFKFAKAGFDDAKWRTLDLPHDWAVELPFVRDDEQTSHGYKPLGRRYPETSVGWYRRNFDMPETDQGRRISVEFDGAFRSVLVFVNGCFIGRNDNGYAPFHFDITDFLTYGATIASLLRVDASMGDGWFYEGAGIYRHVWLTKTDAVHLGKWDSVVRAELKGTYATVSLGNGRQERRRASRSAKVSWKIVDAKGATVATVKRLHNRLLRTARRLFSATAKLARRAVVGRRAKSLFGSRDG